MSTENEILAVQGRRIVRRVTALGGAVVGFFIGSLVIVCIASLYFESQWAIVNDKFKISQQEFSSEIQKRDAQIAAAQASLRDARQSCIPPILNLHAEHIQGIERIERLIVDFPVFKTEIYKAALKNLQDEVSAQSAAAIDLKRVMSGASNGKVPLCSQSMRVSASPQALWSKGDLALEPDGWVLSDSGNSYKPSSPSESNPEKTPGDIKQDVKQDPKDDLSRLVQMAQRSAKQ